MRRHRSINPQASFVFLFLLLSVGCREDGHDPVNPVPIPPAECRLAWITSTDATIAITYNTKGLPVKFDRAYKNSDDNVSDVIEYDGSDNVVKISSKNGFVAYEYNSENKVISTKVYPLINGSFSLVYDALHFYNEAGQLDSTSLQHYPTPGYDRFEYDGRGNVIKVFSRNEGPEKLSRENLEFDDKEPQLGNYFSRYTVLGADVITLSCLVYPVTSDHNVIKSNLLTAGGTWESINYEFEYNDLGYPTKRKTVGAVVDITTNFIYECK